MTQDAETPLEAAGKLAFERDRMVIERLYVKIDHLKSLRVKLRACA